MAAFQQVERWCEAEPLPPPAGSGTAAAGQIAAQLAGYLSYKGQAPDLSRNFDDDPNFEGFVTNYAKSDADEKARIEASYQVQIGTAPEASSGAPARQQTPAGAERRAPSPQGATVETLLADQPDNRDYTMSDGTVWRKSGGKVTKIK